MKFKPIQAESKGANMNGLFIEGRRNGYSPEQCGDTLTVKDLIEELQNYDEDLPVYLSNDNGYTYGNITSSSFEEEELDEKNN